MPKVPRAESSGLRKLQQVRSEALANLLLCQTGLLRGFHSNEPTEHAALGCRPREFLGVAGRLVPPRPEGPKSPGISACASNSEDGGPAERRVAPPAVASVANLAAIPETFSYISLMKDFPKRPSKLATLARAPPPDDAPGLTSQPGKRRAPASRERTTSLGLRRCQRTDVICPTPT
jgi:hypothetical protein